MSITAYVDSDLGSCQQTRRSRTGFLILLGRALIEWKIMMQVGAEHSSYGAELRALSRACFAVVGVRLHLRSFGIEPLGPSVIYIDNASALFAASTLATTLRLRHLCIDYTFVRECVAAGIIEPEKVASRENLSDVLTKDTDEETFWRLTTTMMEGAGTSVQEAKLGRLAVVDLRVAVQRLDSAHLRVVLQTLRVGQCQDRLPLRIDANHGRDSPPLLSPAG